MPDLSFKLFCSWEKNPFNLLVCTSQHSGPLFYRSKSRRRSFMSSDFCSCSFVQPNKKADSKFIETGMLKGRRQQQYSAADHKPSSNSNSFVYLAESVMCFVKFQNYIDSLINRPEMSREVWYVHDMCFSSQVYQNRCVCSCHDREQNSHHWVWHSSLPRPLQKHLLQVTPKPHTVGALPNIWSQVW